MNSWLVMVSSSTISIRSPICRSAGFLSFSRSEEHTSELQSQSNLVCRLLLEKKKKYNINQREVMKFVEKTPNEYRTKYQSILVGGCHCSKYVYVFSELMQTCCAAVRYVVGT